MSRQGHLGRLLGGTCGAYRSILSNPHGKVHGVRYEKRQAYGIETQAHSRGKRARRGAADQGQAWKRLRNHACHYREVEPASRKKESCPGQDSSQPVTALAYHVGGDAFALHPLGLSNNHAKHGAPRKDNSRWIERNRNSQSFSYEKILRMNDVMLHILLTHFSHHISWTFPKVSFEFSTKLS